MNYEKKLNTLYTKMKNSTSGVTIIALVVTIIILIIIAGISITSLTDEKSVMKESDQKMSEAQKESIIEKIEADLYTEKIKAGKTPGREELVKIITDKGYGTVSGDKLTTTEGGYEINLTEIQGWK